MELNPSIRNGTGTKPDEEDHIIESIEVDEEMPQLGRQKGVVHEYPVDNEEDPVFNEMSLLSRHVGASRNAHGYPVDVEPFPAYKDPNPSHQRNQQPLLDSDKSPFVHQKGVSGYPVIPVNWQGYESPNYGEIRSLETPARWGGRACLTYDQVGSRRQTRANSQHAVGPTQQKVAKSSNFPKTDQAGTERTYKFINYDCAGSFNDPLDEAPEIASSDSLGWMTDDEPLAIEDEEDENEDEDDEDDEAFVSEFVSSRIMSTSRGGESIFDLPDDPPPKKPYKSTKATYERRRGKKGQWWESFGLVKKADKSVRRKYRKVDRVTPEMDREKSTTSDEEWPEAVVDHDEYHSRSEPQGGVSPSIWKRTQEQWWRYKAGCIGEPEAERIRERWAAPPDGEKPEIVDEHDEQDELYSRSEPQGGKSMASWERAQLIYWRDRARGLGESEARKIRESYDLPEPKAFQKETLKEDQGISKTAGLEATATEQLTPKKDQGMSKAPDPEASKDQIPEEDHIMSEAAELNASEERMVEESQGTSKAAKPDQLAKGNTEKDRNTS